MNINNYKTIDYTDNEPHTATVAEHIASIAKELRDYCATASELWDYIESNADYIQEIGATLQALSDRNPSDIVTITWADWSGYIIKDEEE
jgi:hypothetical protein